MDKIWVLAIKDKSTVEITAYYDGEAALKHYRALRRKRKRLLRIEFDDELKMKVTREIGKEKDNFCEYW